MKSVLVLLASYNGEKYISQQIESILNQDNCNVSILVSDDGSYDNTIDIIKKYAVINDIKIIKNKISSDYYSGNFYNLIKECNHKKFDYIAYSDQDDVFVPNKYIKSINFLKKNNVYLLSSSVKCFGNSEKILSQKAVKTKFDFIFEGCGQGCTFVMTKNFFSKFKKFVNENTKEIKKFYFHDWATYLFCRSINAKWVFLDQPLTKYRIHQNIAGTRFSQSGIKYRLEKLYNGWYYKQVLYASELYSLINKRNMKLDRISLIHFLYIIIFQSRRKLIERVMILPFLIINKIFR